MRRCLILLCCMTVATPAWATPASNEQTYQWIAHRGTASPAVSSSEEEQSAENVRMRARICSALASQNEDDCDIMEQMHPDVKNVGKGTYIALFPTNGASRNHSFPVILARKEYGKAILTTFKSDTYDAHKKTVITSKGPLTLVNYEYMNNLFISVDAGDSIEGDDGFCTYRTYYAYNHMTHDLDLMKVTKTNECDVAGPKKTIVVYQKSTGTGH